MSWWTCYISKHIADDSEYEPAYSYRTLHDNWSKCHWPVFFQAARCEVVGWEGMCTARG